MQVDFTSTGICDRKRSVSLSRRWILVGVPAVAIGLAFALTVIAPLCKFLLDFPYFSLGHNVGSVWSGFTLSLGIASVCLIFEVIIALHIGQLFVVDKSSVGLLLTFCLPLAVGPTICALLWKSLLAPGGLIAQLLATCSLPFPDWSQSKWGARIVISMVQIWSWGLVGAAAIAVLSVGDTKTARSLYLLDGGKKHLATLWSLWATRREWLAVIILALMVENLRFFDIIEILTAGGPGTATTTFSYLVFEKGFREVPSNGMNNPEEALWALLLILTNILAAWAILIALKWSTSSGSNHGDK